MARYSIDDTTLASIGDGVRKIVGDTRIESIPYDKKQYQFDSNIYNSTVSLFMIPTGGASKLKVVRISCEPDNSNGAMYWDKCNTSVLFPGFNYTSFEIIPYAGVNEVCFYSLTPNVLYTFEVSYFDADGQPITVYIDEPVKNTLTPVEMGDILNNTNLYTEEQYHEWEDMLLSPNYDKPLENYVNERITEIQPYAMAGRYFRNASFPNVSKIKRNGFDSGGGIASYWGVLDIPNVEVIEANAFQNCWIETLDLPKLKKVESYAFQTAYNTKTIIVPNLDDISKSSIFSGCSNLLQLALPAIIGKCGMMVIYNCQKLTKVDFGAGLTTIENYNFQYCDKLETIILRSNSVVSLTNSLASSTSIYKKISYIYVPAAVIEEYKVAANWAPYAEQFRAIEDYPDICGEA